MGKLLVVLVVLCLIVFESEAVLERKDSAVYVTKYEHENLDENGYRFLYELSDGQKREETGYFKYLGDDLKVWVIRGSYSYFVDGKELKVEYVSDENGYRATGSHLPGNNGITEQPPRPAALPAHAALSLLG